MTQFSKTILTLLAIVLFAPIVVFGQNEKKVLEESPKDTVSWKMYSDSDFVAQTSLEEQAVRDTLKSIMALSDSIAKKSKPIKLKKTFVADPKRALWLSLVLPGAGQIYNHKYWKLPIFYGGFLGCTYALLWNSQMYKDYYQAYVDIMDDDPTTASYMNMLPYGYDITGKEEQFKSIFKHKKDFYRKNRDLSIFAFFGVYLLSVIDAYVDAQLSTFDITPDLSMKVEPTIIQQNTSFRKSSAVGVQCSFNF